VEAVVTERFVAGYVPLVDSAVLVAARERGIESVIALFCGRRSCRLSHRGAFSYVGQRERRRSH
jgi:hypothetical protein